MLRDQGASTSDAGPPEAPDTPDELAAVAALLKQAREDQGLSQEALAERLHMGLQQLRALELADGASLPEPVFVIAQARRVADALGLEISHQIEQLRRSEAFKSGGPVLRPEAFAQQATARTAGPPRTVQSSQAGTRPWRGLLVVGAVAAAVVVVGQRIAVTRATLRPVLPSAAQPAAVVPRPTASPQLLLQARQPSWIEVRSERGGAGLFRGLLRGQRRFALDQGLRVLAGRPDLVMVSNQGRAPQALGPISAVRWVRFRPPEPTP